MKTLYSNIYELLEAAKQGLKFKYVFFWKLDPNTVELNPSCFCQWFLADFEIDGIVYSSTEQYMMAEKAKLFEDHEMHKQIISTHAPRLAKSLGRKVKGFNEQTWKKHRFEIVRRGNHAKFSQNTELKVFLLSTKDKVIAEASPVDKIWGIGLAEDHQFAKRPDKWRGQNLLGFALMKVRAELKSS